jgi:hypothetical protein
MGKVQWRAAVAAGMAAGILATAVQVSLWFILTDALPEIFYRDARLAAAIAMGRGALSPPGARAPVLLVATLVHFALSIVYGIIVSWLAARLGARASLLAGAVFGVALYAINMYGFTAIFPWFAASRDKITLTAHIAFGVVAAGAYRIAARRRG